MDTWEDVGSYADRAKWQTREANRVLVKALRLLTRENKPVEGEKIYQVSQYYADLACTSWMQSLVCLLMVLRSVDKNAG